MFEKEMAEEYCNNEVPFDTTESGEKLYTENDLKNSFLAGLKAGRLRWHKVADGDYPNSDTLVLFKTDVDYYIGKIDYSKKVWWTGFCRDDSISNSFVIEWCEIPKYTEESKYMNWVK